VIKIWEFKDKRLPKCRAYLNDFWAIFRTNAPKERKMRPISEISPNLVTLKRLINFDFKSNRSRRP
jgi:hypothetical protein